MRHRPRHRQPVSDRFQLRFLREGDAGECRDEYDDAKYFWSHALILKDLRKSVYTERLYYSDSHLIEFDARVVDLSDRVSGWTAIVLDRTAFYPTGGGQPSDTGTLNGARVVECIDDGDNGVLHVVQGAAPSLGALVHGRVDWSRRLDHMQQHTGQHILSQAFITLFSAPTKSFRVLESSCEIDIELNNPTSEVIERAVELANNVVWE